MKQFKYIWIYILLLSSNMIIAQDKNEKPTSYINLVGRYLENDNSVELRFVPDKKTLLYQGIKNGFTIERAALDDNIKSEDDLVFKQVGTVKAFNEAQWQEIMSKADEKSRQNLELAKDFYDNIDKPTGEPFKLDKGIKQMKEAKSRDDFEYIIFVMNAIKDKNVAKAIGISFIDNQVEKNKTYIYRANIKNPKTYYKIQPVNYLIETKKTVMPKQKIFVVPGDTTLSFIWEMPDLVSGAYAEKKDPKTGQWLQLNKTPELTLGETNRSSFHDENLTNYVTYYYRFYGFNPFGEKVLIGEAKGMPRDLTPPKKPVFKMAKNTKPNEITIKWDVNKPIDKDLKGFIVARGEQNNGKYKVLHKNILPKTARKFIDRKFSKDKMNYYVIQAIDTAGNISSTIPAFVTIIDSIPPTKPKFISGKIDSTGVVTIKIELNKEKDLMGYRLFRSNSDKHEFSVIREGFDDNDSIQKPVQIVFKDTVTLNSLTPYIYYRTKALDKNFNQSNFSDILKVKRPDTIAPVTPVFKKVLVQQKQVALYFAPSNSEDVVVHEMYRKVKPKAPWVKIANLKKDQKQYIDKNVKQGTMYYYTIRAKDDSGLYSKYAIPVKGKPYDNGVRPAVKNLKLVKKDKKHIMKWDYDPKYPNVFFVIYKKDRKGNFRQLTNTEKKEFILKDKATYAIKAFTKDGGQSKLSKPVSLIQ